MQITVTAITVVKNNGSDIIYLETTLPKPTWPFKGNATLRIESASSKTKEYLEENFPDIIPKFM